VNRFVTACSTRGVTIDVTHFPEGTRTAKDAAAAIGCDVGALFRPHSRRHGPRIYVPERLSGSGSGGCGAQAPIEERGIEPKLARLVLVLDGHRTTRVLDVAWRLDVSKTTASRQLDRAERAGLVDKRYLDFDRRGTWIQLTGRGRELRAQVLEVLTSLDAERPAGPAYGMRGTAVLLAPG
jgi:DNA-binding MarR family transcriptional regulator